MSNFGFGTIDHADKDNGGSRMNYITKNIKKIGDTMTNNNNNNNNNTNNNTDKSKKVKSYENEIVFLDDIYDDDEEEDINEARCKNNADNNNLGGRQVINHNNITNIVDGISRITSWNSVSSASDDDDGEDNDCIHKDVDYHAFVMKYKNKKKKNTKKKYKNRYSFNPTTNNEVTLIDYDDDDNDIIIRTVGDDPSLLNEIVTLQHSMIAQQQQHEDKKIMEEKQKTIQQQRKTTLPETYDFLHHYDISTNHDDWTSMMKDEPPLSSQSFYDCDDEYSYKPSSFSMPSGNGSAIKQQHNTAKMCTVPMIDDIEDPRNIDTSNQHNCNDQLSITSDLSSSSKLYGNRYFEKRARRRQRMMRACIILLLISILIMLCRWVSLYKQSKNNENNNVSSGNMSNNFDIQSIIKNYTDKVYDDIYTNTALNPEQDIDNILDPINHTTIIHSMYINTGGKSDYTDSKDKTWVVDEPTYVHGGGTSHYCTNIMKLHNDNTNNTDDNSYYDENDIDNYNILCSERWFDFGRDDELNPNVHLGQTDKGLYEIPVPYNGTYKVTLYFAEFNNTIPTSSSLSSSTNTKSVKNVEIGERVFDIYLEGAIIQKNLDIIHQYNNDHSMGEIALPDFMIAFVQVDGIVDIRDGCISISFKPIIGNPKINAIEIHPVKESSTSLLERLIMEHSV